MARIGIPDGEGLERSRMWQLQPDLAKGVGITGKTLYTQVSLDVRVREIARMRVAQINQCHI
jgi:alkylhydroperoxidase family enzyme